MEQNTRKLNLPAIAFALAALSATLPASALAGGTPHSETVSYSDLNLATEAGVEALDRRLDRAVERVCGEPTVRNLSTKRQIERCHAETWQSIQDERQVAIAKATGRPYIQQAGRASRSQAQVSLAE